MAGLILKLRPHEQLLINGVVVENGDRKARLRVRTEGARILRLRDAMRPEDATTPLKRAYYAAQMAVAGQLKPAQAGVLIDQAMAQHGGVHAQNDRARLASIAEEGDFYQAMRLISEFIDAEAADNAASTASRKAAGA